MVCIFWHENLWRCSIIELFSSSGLHKYYAHFPSEFNWSKVLFGGTKHGNFLCVTSFICYNLMFQKVTSPHYILSPMFQDPTDNSHFYLKTCLKQPLHRLGR
jgi:hypothetical protein